MGTSALGGRSPPLPLPPQVMLELDSACAQLDPWQQPAPQGQHSPTAAVPAPATLILDLELLKTTAKEKAQAKPQLTYDYS